MNKFFVLFVVLLLPFFIYGQTEIKKLSLKEAVETALKNNPQILVAERNILVIEGKILQAGRIPNAEFSIESNEIPTSLSFGDAGEFDFNINQPLEFFGKRSTRIQNTEYEKKIVQINLERIKKIIRVKVKSAYYQSLLSIEKINAIEQNISLLNDFLVQVKDRYQAGASSYLDVLRAKVEVTILKNEMFNENKQFQHNIGSLKILMGIENGISYELGDSLKYRFINTPLDSILTSLLAESKFIEINRIEVERNKSILLLAEKGSLPDFNFGASFQKRQALPFKGYDNFFGLKIGISLPMFYSTGVRGDIQKSSALLDISNIKNKSVKKIITQNIISSYKSLSYAEKQLRFFDKSLLLDVKDELQAGITAYQTNQIDVLNLFDIYRTYRATKLEYIKTIYNCLTARNELDISNEFINN